MAKNIYFRYFLVVVSLVLHGLSFSFKTKYEFAEKLQSLSGQPYDLYRMNYIHAFTPGECLLHCRQRSRCVGFAYSKSEEGCMLYWNIPILKRSENVASYGGDFMFYTVKRDNCPSTYTLVKNIFLKLHHDHSTWIEAKNTCAAEGSHLYLLDSELKRQVLIAELQRQGHNDVNLWIDGNDIGEEGMWLNWKSENYTTNMWNTGEPNDALGFENCLELGHAYRMNDFTCTARKAFVCECEQINTKHY